VRPTIPSFSASQSVTRMFPSSTSRLIVSATSPRRPSIAALASVMLRRRFAVKRWRKASESFITRQTFWRVVPIWWATCAVVQPAASISAASVQLSCRRGWT